MIGNNVYVKGGSNEVSFYIHVRVFYLRLLCSIYPLQDNGPIFFSSRSYECMNESRLVVSKADYIAFLVDNTGYGIYPALIKKKFTTLNPVDLIYSMTRFKIDDTA